MSTIETSFIDMSQTNSMVSCSSPIVEIFRSCVVKRQGQMFSNVIFSEGKTQRYSSSSDGSQYFNAALVGRASRPVVTSYPYLEIED